MKVFCVTLRGYDAKDMSDENERFVEWVKAESKTEVLDCVWEYAIDVVEEHNFKHGTRFDLSSDEDIELLKEWAKNPVADESNPAYIHVDD